jgi:hypothetical protein
MRNFAILFLKVYNIMSEGYNENQYINLELSVPHGQSGESIVIDQTNNQPILQEDISMYDIAVARMNLPMGSIPLFLLDKDILSTLLVEVEYLDQSSVRNVQYRPFTNLKPQPFNNPVLYIDEFLFMVNASIIEALEDLIFYDIPPPQEVLDTVAFFRIDTEAQRIELKFPIVWQDARVNLRMSRTLHNLFFSGFPVRTIGVDDPEFATRLPVEFLIFDSIFVIEHNFITFKSEYNTIPNFNKVHRIFLKTELPILDTIESSTNNDKTKLILDILPEQNTPSREKILYAPPSYVFHDIVGSSPLYELQFRVFVSFTTDPEKKYPVRIRGGESFTCKLVLRKKEK